MSNQYLLFDIGATKMRLAKTIDGVDFESPIVVSTPADFNEAMDLFQKTAESLSNDGFTMAIGGVAGPLLKRKGILLTSHLSDWVGRPIYEDLTKRLSCDVILENDCALAGLGEAIYGGGRDSKIIAYLTASTGVNGVRIVDRAIDTNSMGFEIGKQIINNGASLESLIGGAMLHKKHGERPEYLQDGEVWSEVNKNLAYGVVNTILYWSPEIIILGGGMIDRISVEVLTSYCSEILEFYPELPPIIKSKLGDYGGVWGALHLLSTVL